MPETLEQKVNRLEKIVRDLKFQMEYRPSVTQQQKTIIEEIVGNQAEKVNSSYIENNYDQVVNEGGASSYEVPKDFDGLSLINGKLYGYYNP